MKKMKCSDLGGACDLEFYGETFEEIADQSKAHGMDMYKKNDQAHLKAMAHMQQLMTDPEAMKAWYEEKKKDFQALPHE